MENGDFAGHIVGIFCAVLFGHCHCHCHSKSLIKRTPTDSVNVAHVTGGQRGGWLGGREEGVKSGKLWWHGQEHGGGGMWHQLWHSERKYNHSSRKFS